METDPEATPTQYRREAEHRRHAVEMIEDARLLEQLLSFARQYDVPAGSNDQRTADGPQHYGLRADELRKRTLK
jgi:hypothetical protein